MSPPDRFCLENPLTSLDALFDADDDSDNEPQRSSPLKRKSLPAVIRRPSATTLPGGRRLSADLSALPGNDWMKPFAAGATPATAPTARPKLQRGGSLPDLKRDDSDDVPSLPKRQSLTELIDIDHPASSSEPSPQSDGPSSPGLRKRRSGGMPPPGLLKRSSSSKVGLGEHSGSGSDEETMERQRKRVSFGALPTSGRVSRAASFADEEVAEAEPAAPEEEEEAELLLEEVAAEAPSWAEQYLAEGSFWPQLQQQQMLPQYPAYPQMPMMAQQQLVIDPYTGLPVPQMMAPQMMMPMAPMMAPQMMAPQMPYMVQPQMMAPMAPMGFAPQMAPQQMGWAQQPMAQPMMAPQMMPAEPELPTLPTLPRGGLLTMAKEPKPSRWLQGVLPQLAPAQLEQVAEELKPDLRNLCTHPFGNYLVSKLASLASLQPALLEALRGHVVALMSHPQGSRVVQAALKALPVPAAAELVSELRGHVAAVAGDTHGSWSVCVAFEKTHAPFMLEEVAAQLGALALLPHGGRVVQSALTAGAAAGLDLTPLVSAILAAGPAKLATHAYANYAVQLALKHGQPAQVRALAAALLPALLQLAASKYGSNVAESLLSTADAAELRAAAELVASSGGVQQLVEHEYGNYVLQALIRRAAPEQRQALLDQVVRGGPGVERSRDYSRIVLSRIAPSA